MIAATVIDVTELMNSAGTLWFVQAEYHGRTKRTCSEVCGKLGVHWNEDLTFIEHEEKRGGPITFTLWSDNMMRKNTEYSTLTLDVGDLQMGDNIDQTYTMFPLTSESGGSIHIRVKLQWAQESTWMNAVFEPLKKNSPLATIKNSEAPIEAQG
eukprot:CAMPEP_0114564100 /NCGR_PEP_ID=MMETSP0114-20121206/13505_1 /TAXON_ID=31324 /ORGANISM="Goniomonas sp, Strain m" /LENGTH=153 /DNA_ID=CAMNT_0001750075 /DNA_START=137 /DNA_END=598 /DNA_ORIENTATION=-